MNVGDVCVVQKHWEVCCREGTWIIDPFDWRVVVVQKRKIYSYSWFYENPAPKSVCEIPIYGRKAKVCLAEADTVYAIDEPPTPKGYSRVRVVGHPKHAGIEFDIPTDRLVQVGRIERS